MMPPNRALWVLALSLALTATVVPRSLTAIVPSIHGFYAIPKVEIREVGTQTGLILYTPNRGDQCWDSHLNCAPYPNQRLRLRVPGNLAQGFAVVR